MSDGKRSPEPTVDACSVTASSPAAAPIAYGESFLKRCAHHAPAIPLGILDLSQRDRLVRCLQLVLNKSSMAKAAEDYNISWRFPKLLRQSCLRTVLKKEANPQTAGTYDFMLLADAEGPPAPAFLNRI